MKQRYQILDEQQELSSDLEWMMQSGQVSRKMLLETLGKIYYQPLYRLAFSLLEDPGAARQAVQKIFERALLELHRYRSQVGVEAWLYRVAWKECLRVYRKERLWRGLENLLSLRGALTETAPSAASNPVEQSIWDAFDSLDQPIQWFLVLTYVHGWAEVFIAQISGDNVETIQSYLKAGREDILRRCQNAGLGEDDFDSLVTRALQARRQARTIPSDGLDQMIVRAEGQAKVKHRVRGGLATFNELMMIALAIVLVVVLIWGGDRYLVQPQTPGPVDGAFFTGQQSRERGASTGEEVAPTATSFPEGIDQKRQPSPTATRNPPPTPTPVGIFYIIKRGDTLGSIAERLRTSVDELVAFNRLMPGRALTPGMALVIPGSVSTEPNPAATPVGFNREEETILPPLSSEEIYGLINSAGSHFSTLWLDAQILTYPNDSDKQSPQADRIQVWLSESQVLLVGGQSDQLPEEVLIVTGGRGFVARPGLEQPWFHRISSGDREPPIDLSLLTGLYYLISDREKLYPAKFVLLGESQVAGRGTWVVSQNGVFGKREALLWLDKRTGAILRYRQYRAQTIFTDLDAFMPTEAMVTGFAYDVDFPQELFNTSLPWRGGYARDYSGDPARIDDLTVSQEGPLTVSALDLKPPPAGLAVERSRIGFAFPVSPEPDSSDIHTAVFADGYYLGRFEIGTPWDLSCQRSNDGKVLALADPPLNAINLLALNNRLFFLQLESNLEIQSALPEGVRISGHFALSPDSSSVALWGCDENLDWCGIFHINRMSGETRQVFSLPYGATDLVWSPDGEFLAMIAAIDSFIVIDIGSGEIVYKGPFDRSMGAEPPDAPTYDWGVEFPPSHGRLENCLLPREG